MTTEARLDRLPLRGPVGRRLSAQLDAVKAVLERGGALHVEVFGSVARGDDRHNSDLDLLADFAPGVSMLDIIGMKNDLEDLLGTPVDLIPRSGLRQRVRTAIERDRIPL